MLELNNLGVLVIIAVALNTFLFVKILIQPSQDKILKTLLIFLIVCLSALVVNHLYRYQTLKLYASFPHLSGLALILSFYLGPVFYWYVNKIALGQLPWHKARWYLHLLLPLLVTLYISPHFTRTAEEKLLSFQSQQDQFFRGILYLLNYGLVLFYLKQCWKPLNRYQQGILNNYSNIQTITLNWLRSVCMGLAVIMALGVLIILLNKRDSLIYAVFLGTSAILTIAFVFSALRHRQLLISSMIEPHVTILSDNGIEKQNVEILEDEEDEQKLDVKTVHNHTPKYSRSGLDEETLQKYLAKLQSLMNSEQLFLQESLSLGNLAEALNMSTHHLSQVLNERLKTNFYDYINGLRIDYAKKLLIDSPDKPVMDIAYASGYNSKSTFYKAFKRHLNSTPVDYRGRYQLNSAELRQAK